MSNPSECPICRAGPVGLKWIRDFHTRSDITLDDLANYFTMRVEDVQDHITNHEIIVNMGHATTNGRNLSSPDFYLNEVLSLLEAMRNVFEVKMQQEWDASTVKQLKDLHDAMMNDIKTLAELQGRLKGPGDAETKILQVQGDLNMIIESISGGELCPKCEAKMMQRLQTIQHKLA